MDNNPQQMPKGDSQPAELPNEIIMWIRAAEDNYSHQKSDQDGYRAGATDMYRLLIEAPRVWTNPPKVHPIFKGWDSAALIGRSQLRFEQLRHKGWDWRSFYNGWLEGRADMLAIFHHDFDADAKITQLRGERDAYAINFAEWAASQLWELYPECEEDEEQLWYRRSYDKDEDEPDDKVTSSQLLELFKNQYPSPKQQTP